MRMHSKHRYSYVPTCVRSGTEQPLAKPCNARFHYKWCKWLNQENVRSQGRDTYLYYRRQYFLGMYVHLFSPDAEGT